MVEKTDTPEITKRPRGRPPRSPHLATNEDVARAKLRQHPREPHEEDLLTVARAAAEHDQPGSFVAPGFEMTGTIRHVADAPVPMWKPDGQYGWRRLIVPRGNMVTNLDAGWRLECPDCGDDCGSDLKDFNRCPGRNARPYRQCPVQECGKKFYDPGESRLIDTQDPALISSGDIMVSTAEARTQLMWEEHMKYRHPRTWAEIQLSRSVQEREARASQLAGQISQLVGVDGNT